LKFHEKKDGIFRVQIGIVEKRAPRNMGKVSYLGPKWLT
jgi:hypothetical protein